jgi:hypothetical protein
VRGRRQLGERSGRIRRSERRPAGAREGGKGLKAGALGWVRKAVEEFGEKVTEEALELAKKAGIDCTVEMINEHPHEALMTAATKHGARMIVVVQLSETPVLVVRP